jgi:nitrate reductase gamma subunit
VSPSERHLARPLYEGLPWLYAVLGVGALFGSYLAVSPLVSVALGLPGLAALLGGIVVWLRRRGYRRMRLQYACPDALAERGTDSAAE